MPKLDANERSDLARDCTQIAGDLNWVAISLMSGNPSILVDALIYIKNLEARAKVLFDKLKADIAD